MVITLMESCHAGLVLGKSRVFAGHWLLDEFLFEKQAQTARDAVVTVALLGN